MIIIYYMIINKHELELFKKYANELNFNFSIRPGNPFKLKKN